MNRYEAVIQDVFEVLKEVRENYFSELSGAEIFCIFDTKKKISNGRFQLASIRIANDFEKFLTLEDTGAQEGFDYIIRIDKKVWEMSTRMNKFRLLRHELRHTNVDPEAKKPWKLRPHSLEDFYTEIRLNEDEPRWAQELTGKALAAYEEEDPKE